MTQNPPLQTKKNEVSFCRRSFIKLTGGAGITLVAAPTLLIPKSINAYPLQSPAMKVLNKKQDLTLCFYNRHTGEALKKCTFWAEGKYDHQALKAINKLFRDHRTGDIREIDRNLLHLLHSLKKKLETSEVYHLISGYRSPQSNNMLHERSGGVAKRSLHLQGKAADIYVPGRSLVQVQSAAKSLRVGGVGRYSQFVHIDTGRLRYWGKT